MRGPALKGRKMNGFGTRYFWTRSSMNLSGSNESATQERWRQTSVAEVRVGGADAPSGPQRSFLRCMSRTEYRHRTRGGIYQSGCPGVKFFQVIPWIEHLQQAHVNSAISSA